MPDAWRLIDTGLASPVRNIALSRALLEARSAEEIASTLRFGRSTRCVLIGAGQSAEQELDLEYCREHGIACHRRITSGSPTYLDEQQLLFELYLHRRDVGGETLHAVGRRITHAAATALQALGVDARLRDRGQIEIDGRTVGHGGFAVEGEALLFQAALSLDGNPAAAMSVVRTPWSGEPPALQVEAAKRMTSLAEALGAAANAKRVKPNLAEAFESEFGIEFREADLGLSEHARCEAALPAIDARDWLDHAAAAVSEAPLLVGVHRGAGGMLSAAVIYERATGTLHRVWIMGDCRFAPRRLLADLESVLCDIPLARVAARVESFFGSRSHDFGGFGAADFIAVLERAVRQPLLADNS